MRVCVRVRSCTQQACKKRTSTQKNLRISLYNTACTRLQCEIRRSACVFMRILQVCHTIPSWALSIPKGALTAFGLAPAVIRFVMLSSWLSPSFAASSNCHSLFLNTTFERTRTGQDRMCSVVTQVHALQNHSRTYKAESRRNDHFRTPECVSCTARTCRSSALNVVENA